MMVNFSQAEEPRLKAKIKHANFNTLSNDAFTKLGQKDKIFFSIQHCINSYLIYTVTRAVKKGGNPK